MEPSHDSFSQPDSIPTTIVAPTIDARAPRSESFPADWILCGVVLGVGMLLCLSRWSGARTARRLNAAAEVYASREITRQKDVRRPASTRRTEPTLSAPQLLENVPCSS